MPGVLPRPDAPWRDRRNRALADTTMQAAVERSARSLAEKKLAAYAAYPSGEQLRKNAVNARRAGIADADHLLEEFAEHVRRQGGHVTRASGPADVGRQVLEIAHRRGAHRIVKSKSMATEEVELNRQLEADGLHVRETDLGEYIIQLAGEHPAHILVPASHKTREQVLALFDAEADSLGAKRAGGAGTDELTLFARHQMREEFLSSDMGITGGNFLVAETGTLVLISNEGNARMTTSLPPVHVAVVGIDKIVATWEDLALILQQPALSGTGQRISTYTTFVTGPRRPDELDGPDEFHLILLDNGRHDLLGTEFEDVLSCIRCGACLNVCPVFRRIGGQAYGSVYSGPIGVVATPLLGGLEHAPELPKLACSLCYACGDACPMEIDLPGHILALRRSETDAKMESLSVRLTFRLWGTFWASTLGFRATAVLGRIGQLPFKRGGQLRGLPGLVGGWTAERDAPPIATRTFHEWWRSRPRARSE